MLPQPFTFLCRPPLHKINPTLAELDQRIREVSARYDAEVKREEKIRADLAEQLKQSIDEHHKRFYPVLWEYFNLRNQRKQLLQELTKERRTAWKRNRKQQH